MEFIFFTFSGILFKDVGGIHMETLYFTVIAESYSLWLLTADAALPENIVNAKANIGSR